MFKWSSQDPLHSASHEKDACLSDDQKNEEKKIEPHLLDEAWHMLYDDCLSALEICVEGELKHFHKARYKLAQGLYKRGEGTDLERAKDELSFCFKSSRSAFTINMWEIDGTAKKGRYKLSIFCKAENLTRIKYESLAFSECHNCLIHKLGFFYFIQEEKSGPWWK